MEIMRMVTLLVEMITLQVAAKMAVIMALTIKAMIQILQTAMVTVSVGTIITMVVIPVKITEPLQEDNLAMVTGIINITLMIPSVVAMAERLWLQVISGIITARTLH